MNHLLHQISWHQYLVIAFVAAIIYYLFVIFRCYRPELQTLLRRLSGDKPGEELQALQYQPAEEAINTVPVHGQTEEPYREEAITNTDILKGKLKACIIKVADKPFAPAILIPQLKKTLQEHQDIDASGRPAINRLVVGECERTGTALLTEEEVDQWWER
ncbi:hypothetical protein ACFGVS_00555 [Mucilaginibacter sp. AW1-7]|uniref:hypothetical protein n=1 Tax=Mucilaginibacter sp. AW1-7 TaxID=3349874 RepID=UPI003F73AE58